MSINQTYSKKIIRRILNIPGFHTKRKCLVIESDDWGSIRMPSFEAYSQLKSEGHNVDSLVFNKYDSLASETDLINLFEVLKSVQDKNGNYAKITANTIVANPDFKRIKESGFTEYYYEPFTQTLSRYSEHVNSFELWKQGIATGVFYPQFHGREHLNVPRWMKALQQKNEKARRGFELEMYDMSEGTSISENTYVDALNYSDISELEFQKRAIIEGLNLFEEIFGYRSKTMIAPCYIWSKDLEYSMSQGGVKGIQGSWFQLKPIAGNNTRLKKHFNYLGKKNKTGQTYLVRNVYFEPSNNPDYDWISEVLNKIENSFDNNKPAIMCSHRINYIGYIDPVNRDRNLQMLSDLLQAIIKKWPDIEFMSSDQMLDLITHKNG